MSIFHFESFILLPQVGKISYSGEAGAAAEESFSTSTGKNFPPDPIHVVFTPKLLFWSVRRVTLEDVSLLTDEFQLGDHPHSPRSSMHSSRWGTPSHICQAHIDLVNL